MTTRRSQCCVCLVQVSGDLGGDPRTPGVRRASSPSTAPSRSSSPQQVFSKILLHRSGVWSPLPSSALASRRLALKPPTPDDAFVAVHLQLPRTVLAIPGHIALEKGAAACGPSQRSAPLIGDSFWECSGCGGLRELPRNPTLFCR